MFHLLAQTASNNSKPHPTPKLSRHFMAVSEPFPLFQRKRSRPQALQHNLCLKSLRWCDPGTGSTLANLELLLRYPDTDTGYTSNALCRHASLSLAAWSDEARLSWSCYTDSSSWGDADAGGGACTSTPGAACIAGPSLTNLSL
jgi:hypothetical protein